MNQRKLTKAMLRALGTYTIFQSHLKPVIADNRTREQQFILTTAGDMFEMGFRAAAAMAKSGVDLSDFQGDEVPDVEDELLGVLEKMAELAAKSKIKRNPDGSWT